MWAGSVVVWMALVCAAVAAPATWTVKEENGERSTDVTGTAAVGDLRVSAFLRLSCNRTGNPVAWLDYTLADVEEVTKVFDLEPFEGPDAPAQSRPLVEIEVVGGPAAPPLLAHASGWYSAEHAGGFGFGVGGQRGESKVLSALIRRMAREGTALRLRVNSFAKSKPSIVSEFPLAGAREVLSRVGEVCR